MMEIKKICYVIPSLRKGGLERVSSILANQAAKSSLDVSIITLIPNIEIEYPIDDRVKIYNPNFKYTKSVFFKISILFFLIRTLRLISPDVIISFGENFNPLSIISAKILRIRVFISDRSSPTLYINFINRFIKKITYPFASGIIAQTETAQSVLQAYNNNVFVLPNPIRDINDTYTKQEDKIIISVGRLVKSKNFKELITIFKNINRFDWKLYILGDGPEYDELLHFIEINDLKNNVFLKGKIDDVDYYFSKSSIFAFTSLSEGFPNALNEAMSFPLPAIAYNCIAGPSDLIVNEENGFLVDVEDKETYIDILNNLMDDKELRDKIKRNSIENRNKYSKEMIFNNLLKCIKK